MEHNVEELHIQTADIYSAINQSGLFKGYGFYIYVISEHFDYATDCAPVIISGKDGYKQEDFAYESYHKKYKKAANLAAFC